MKNTHDAQTKNKQATERFSTTVCVWITVNTQPTKNVAPTIRCTFRLPRASTKTYNNPSANKIVRGYWKVVMSNYQEYFYIPKCIVMTHCVHINSQTPLQKGNGPVALSTFDSLSRFAVKNTGVISVPWCACLDNSKCFHHTPHKNVARDICCSLCYQLPSSFTQTYSNLSVNKKIKGYWKVLMSTVSTAFFTLVCYLQYQQGSTLVGRYHTGLLITS